MIQATWHSQWSWFAGDGIGWNPHRWFDKRCLMQNEVCSSPDRRLDFIKPTWSQPADVVWCCMDSSIFKLPDISHRSNKQECKHTSAYRNVFTIFVYIYRMERMDDRFTRERACKPILLLCVCVYVTEPCLTVGTYSNSTSYEFPPWSVTIISLSLSLFLSRHHTHTYCTHGALEHACVIFSVLHNFPEKLK